MLKSIVAPLVVVIGLWVSASTITTHYIGRIETSYEQSHAENLTTIVAADAAQVTFWRLHGLVWKLQAVVREAPEPLLASLRKELQDRTDEFLVNLKNAESTCFTEPEKQCVKKIRLLFDSYTEHFKSRAGSPTNTEFLTRAHDAERSQLVHGIADECQKLNELNAQLIATSARESAQMVRYLLAGRYITVIVIPLMGGIVGFWISRRLHRSVAKISVTLGDVAGKLGYEVGHLVVKPLADLPSLQEQVQGVAMQIQRVVDELQEARFQVMAVERLAVAGELAAGVAHEIRNPLTSIKLLIQMTAQRGSDRSLGEKQLQVIQGEIARIEKTIQGLLDFARPPRLDRTVHDLRDTVRRALSLLDGRARQQGVTICERLSTVPQAVNGDPEQVYHVLVNLLINGIEAMPDGGTLGVNVDRDEQFPGHCRIVVSDSGPGIRADVMPRLFDPFTTTKKDGVGLGLAISRRIIQEHEGTIEAANRPEGGAAIHGATPPQHHREQRRHRKAAGRYATQPPC